MIYSSLVILDGLVAQVPRFDRTTVSGFRALNASKWAINRERKLKRGGMLRTDVDTLACLLEEIDNDVVPSPELVEDCRNIIAYYREMAHERSKTQQRNLIAHGGLTHEAG